MEGELDPKKNPNLGVDIRVGTDCCSCGVKIGSCDGFAASTRGVTEIIRNDKSSDCDEKGNTSDRAAVDNAEDHGLGDHHACEGIVGGVSEDCGGGWSSIRKRNRKHKSRNRRENLEGNNGNCEDMKPVALDDKGSTYAHPQRPLPLVRHNKVVVKNYVSFSNESTEKEKKGGGVAEIGGGIAEKESGCAENTGGVAEKGRMVKEKGGGVSETGRRISVKVKLAEKRGEKAEKGSGVTAVLAEKGGKRRDGLTSAKSQRKVNERIDRKLDTPRQSICDLCSEPSIYMLSCQHSLCAECTEQLLNTGTSTSLY